MTRVKEQANERAVAAGLQMGNTVISSYIVDCYPLQSMSVITFYSVFLNLSAFINPVRPSPQHTMTVAKTGPSSSLCHGRPSRVSRGLSLLKASSHSLQACQSLLVYTSLVPV